MRLDCCAIGPSMHMRALRSRTHVYHHERVEARASDTPSRSGLECCSGGVGDCGAVLCLKLGTVG